MISQVDTEIFRLRYFMHCMACTFCHDSCCQYGADIEQPMITTVLEHRQLLGELVPVPAERWFEDYRETDPDYPSGVYTRTRVENGRCVFLNRSGRGCLLHQYSLTQGTDFRNLKPLVCSLFPASFSNGVLYPALEVSDGSLICSGQGPTVYQAARNDIAYFFEADLVRELDQLQLLCAEPTIALTDPQPYPQPLTIIAPLSP